MSGPRLFVAIAIPDDVRRILHQAAGLLLAGCPGGRPRVVPRAQLHLTLRFYGVERGGLTRQRLALSLGRRLRRLPPEPVHLRASGIGAFPSVRRGRVVWSGLVETGGSGRLSRIQRITEGAARELGLHTEGRRFVPHVTLARLRTPARIPGEILQAMDALVCGDPPPVFAARRIHLFGSILTSAGAEHELLASIPFGASPLPPDAAG